MGLTDPFEKFRRIFVWFLLNGLYHVQAFRSYTLFLALSICTSYNVLEGEAPAIQVPIWFSQEIALAWLGVLLGFLDGDDEPLY